MNESSFDWPSRLSSVLSRVVRQKGLAEQSSSDHLVSLWKQIAGERVSSRSHVRKLKNGILEIAVRNGAILEELNGFLKPELLAAIQQAHPTPVIRDLKFVQTRRPNQ